MPPAPPRFSGAALRALALATRTPVGALAARALFRRDLGIDQLARLPESWRGATPIDNDVVPGRPPRRGHDESLGAPSPGDTWPRGSASLGAAYRSGRLSPLTVATASLAAARALAARTPFMGPLLTYDDAAAERDALASQERHRAGRPLGPLDGIPFVVKEEMALKGFPVRIGTTCLPPTPATEDASLVARLRAAGAIPLGLTPMTEYGLSPLGVSARRRLPRNPHHPGRVAGGSSTGTAVAIALGLCPFGTAADGGGSIRIPAAFCGLFGIKPTWGRVTRAGDAFGGTMDHLGPIGATTLDLALFLEASAGPDPGDRATLDAPPLAPGELVAALGRGVRGLRIGVLNESFDQAVPSLAKAGREALAALERAGATLVAVRLEPGRLAGAAGSVIIASESYAVLRDTLRTRPDDLGDDLQITLQTAGALAVDDYLDAQRLRTGLRAATAALLREVDLLALPTTAIVPPPINDAEAASGIADVAAIGGACGNSFLANLTGLPAGTAPVGVDADGLPLGLQFIGDAHDEATVLAALAHLERLGVALPPRPPAAIDLLSLASAD